MSLRLPIKLAVEGLTDEVVIRRVLRHTNLTSDPALGFKGKHHLLQRLASYNQAAKFANWLVIIDLDQDSNCAPSYIKTILPEPSEGMLLRIPVRAIEAWLLADQERLAGFLGISSVHIPVNPDQESNPKVTLLNLVRRSPKKSLREDMLPRPNSSSQIGPGYAGRIQEFVEVSKHHWRPDIAAQNSDSLRRCILALSNWKMIAP